MGRWQGTDKLTKKFFPGLSNKAIGRVDGRVRRKDRPLGQADL
jgi:hypothetical protein